MDDTVDSFIAQVMQQVPEIRVNKEEVNFTDLIRNMHRKKYTIDDAVAYCRCFEEVNPELNEDEAIARMEAIQEKYVPVW